MVINHNMSSLYAQRMEGINTHNVQKSIEKLSSGQKSIVPLIIVLI